MRKGSVSGAARDLHVTDGAVSRAVREFEAQLGVSLFERRNRQVIATEAARTLADEVRTAIEQLALALARAKGRGVENRPLTLSCEPTFLIRWLIPRLPLLQAVLGSEREIRLVSAGGAPPFLREGIDLAIRRADFPMGADVVSAPFLDERVGPVCRPEIRLEQEGALTGVLLHSATRPDAWARWAALSGAELAPARAITFEHFYLSLQAAIAGAGIAIGPIALVADDLETGALVAPRGLVADGSHYALMAPTAAHDEQVFGIIAEWLRAECSQLSKWSA